MKVTEYFEKANGETLISFEVLPPLKGGSMKAIFDVLDPLMEFKPPFIDVTYHREDFIYKQRESGYYEKAAIRKRPGTVGICAAIMHRYGVDAVPHLLCGGFTKEDTENALIDLNFLNINNVLALRGDARKFDGKFIREPHGHQYALDLIKQINDINNGKYLDKNIENGVPTDFCIGAAGYPEKHSDAANMVSDLKFLKRKVDVGAAFITTQMFFDNQKYIDYVAMCRAAGIMVPIIPGIKPITTKGQLRALPKIFNMDIPEPLASELEKAKDDTAARQIGIEWCIQQCKELKSLEVPALHFYTMSFSSATKEVVSQIL